jgi:hypothetical protein
MARLLFFILTMLWFIYVKAGNTIPYIGLGYEVAQLPYRRGYGTFYFILFDGKIIGKA